VQQTRFFREIPHEELPQFEAGGSDTANAYQERVCT
jgi:hypothetical protein